MNPARPHATHVAVRDGRILGAGTLEELVGWGDYRLDERFAGKVLMPGLVEGHSHVMEGSLWAYVYCGFFDRMDPEGAVWPGLKSIDAVVERLREAADALEDPDALARILADPTHGLLRAKGFMRRPAGAMAAIQTVGSRWTVSDAPANAPAGLVCIGLEDRTDFAALRRAIGCP